MKILAALFITIVIQIQSTAQDPEGLYPFTSTRQVTADDITDKSLQDLKIMRNEVFARHGHTFKSEDLKAHFGAQPWYKPTTADASALLTPLEKQNVDFIRKWETRITTTADFNDFFQVFSKAVKANDVNKLGDLVYIDMIESIEEFKKSYAYHAVKIKEAIPDGDVVNRGDDERMLAYGEYYSGTQYKFVQFKKIGCCWYIYAFQQVD